MCIRKIFRNLTNEKRGSYNNKLHISPNIIIYVRLKILCFFSNIIFIKFYLILYYIYFKKNNPRYLPLANNGSEEQSATFATSEQHRWLLFACA